MAWSDRVASLIRDAGTRVLVHCDRDSGIQHAIDRLVSQDVPLVCVWLEEPLDSIAFGNLLSEAVSSALGSPLFGKNVPYEYGLAVLQRHIGLLAPLRFVIGWTQYCTEASERLVEIVRPPNSLVLVTDKDTRLDYTEGFAHINPDDVVLHLEEAHREVSAVLTPAQTAVLWERSRHLYGRFRKYFHSELGLTEAVLPLAREIGCSLTHTGHRAEVEEQIAAYRNRSRWIEAFNLACEYDPERAEEIVERAANQLFDLGQCDYLWTRLNRLPPDVKRRPVIAYWLFAAAVATNRQNLVMQLVDNVLRDHRAPLLRAAVAVQRVSRTTLADTQAALADEISPVTLRAHAFALASHGHREEPLQYYRQALGLAGREGQHHLVIASAVDISNHEICLGRYRSGAEWARWALSEYATRGLGEELRRTAALASLAFARLLAGELSRESGLVSGLVLPDSAVGIPGTEGVLSTLADIALVRGDVNEAERLYRRNYEAAPLDGNAFAALDLVKCLLAAGRDTDAHAVAEMTWAVSQFSTAQEAAFGLLARGMVSAYRGLDESDELLEGALHGLSQTSYVLHEALARVWLAMFQLESGSSAEARKTLDAAEDGLRELGDSGWRWMGSTNSRIGAVQQLWCHPSAHCELRFLGARSVKVNTREVSVRLRHCEALAILAHYPDGIGPQRLALWQYGERGSAATAKANISHLRKHIAITSAPYRIADSFDADFIRLMAHLENSELQLALNLYDGPLLENSSAPAVVELREHIDASLRSAVIAARDPDALIQLATALQDDLELWERARDNLSPHDHRRPLVNARIRRIRDSWDL